MNKSIPPKVQKFPAAKQRQLDRLLEKNSEGKISTAELETLKTLVAEAEELMVKNAKRLAKFAEKQNGRQPTGATPVTVWVQPQAQHAEPEMATAESFRELVEARAGGGCEYCRLLQAATGVTFHIEHFKPRSQGGKTNLRNLILSCPGCNLSKADRTTAEDDDGETQRLFNPRDYEPWLLGWHLHFSLDLETGLIIPRTHVAEASVNALRMNDPLRVFARKLQIDVGLIA